jgi:hypothetical protein
MVITGFGYAVGDPLIDFTGDPGTGTDTNSNRRREVAVLDIGVDSTAALSCL